LRLILSIGLGIAVENIIYVVSFLGVLAVLGKSYLRHQGQVQAKIKQENAAKRRSFLSLPAPAPVGRKRKPQFGRR
jgi:hypothetical protein